MLSSGSPSLVLSPNGVPELGFTFSDAELNQYYMAPLALFEIVDPRASRQWEVSVHETGAVSIVPPPLGRDHFMEDFHEKVTEVVEEFRRIQELLEGEFQDSPA
jgi:hypothetical protein